MQTHITLESNGMGVNIRESRSGVQVLLEKEGFEYIIVQDYITMFENNLYKQYSKNREKEEKTTK